MGEDRVLQLVRERTPERVVLAVSGGRDSMALLDAVARVVPDRVALVATFDHGTGAFASEAAALVARASEARGLPWRIGGRSAGPETEATWRTSRWRFLRAVAREFDAVVATAHTRDDHLETLMMRILRGSGARGIAGLHADTGVARPLLTLSREDVARYTAVRDVPWVSDPSNASMRYLRNRVRRDLLPALAAVRPTLSGEILALGDRAATLRREVEALGARLPYRVLRPRGFAVARDPLALMTPEGLAVLWPAVAARGGVVLDRRGTRRLVTFTRLARTGQRIQLAGGFEVTCEPSEWAFRPLLTNHESRPVALADGARLGPWRFARAERGNESPWEATLPLTPDLTIRAWRPGDRMAARGRTFRRVKRYLKEAGISGLQRVGWPVVEVSGDIVWVPGVCRSDAATDRSGGPAMHVICERTDG